MNIDRKIWQWLMLLGLAFIWGTSFILMKRGLESYTPTQVAGMRIFITFIFLLPLIFKHFKKLNRDNIVPLIIVGLIGNAMPAFLYALGQTQIVSSLAGMLNSLTPMFTLIIGVILFRLKSKLINVIGIIIGLIGAIGLVIEDYSIFFNGNNWYALLIVLATAAYGYNINVVKTRLQSMSGVAITALAFLFAGPIAGIALLFSDFSQAVASDNAGINFIYILLLAFFSSTIAVIGINILIKHTTAVFASSVTYIIPIFAIMWGLIDGESISYVEIISMVVLLAGVYLINKTKKTV